MGARMTICIPVCARMAICIPVCTPRLRLLHNVMSNAAAHADMYFPCARSIRLMHIRMRRVRLLDGVELGRASDDVARLPHPRGDAGMHNRMGVGGGEMHTAHPTTGGPGSAAHHHETSGDASVRAWRYAFPCAVLCAWRYAFPYARRAADPNAHPRTCMRPWRRRRRARRRCGRTSAWRGTGTLRRPTWTGCAPRAYAVLHARTCGMPCVCITRVWNGTFMGLQPQIAAFPVLLSLYWCVSGYPFPRLWHFPRTRGASGCAVRDWALCITGSCVT